MQGSAPGARAVPSEPERVGDLAGERAGRLGQRSLRIPGLPAGIEDAPRGDDERSEPRSIERGEDVPGPPSLDPQPRHEEGGARHAATQGPDLRGMGGSDDGSDRAPTV